MPRVLSVGLSVDRFVLKRWTLRLYLFLCTDNEKSLLWIRHFNKPNSVFHSQFSPFFESLVYNFMRLDFKNTIQEIPWQFPSITTTKTGKHCSNKEYNVRFLLPLNVSYSACAVSVSIPLQSAIPLFTKFVVLLQKSNSRGIQWS